MKHRLLILLSNILLTTAALVAQTSVQAPLMGLPLVFQQQSTIAADTIATPALTMTETQGNPLDVDDEWLRQAQAAHQRLLAARYAVMVTHPELVAFNAADLPDVPRNVELKSSPRQGLLTVAPQTIDQPLEQALPEAPVNMRNWLHTFVGSLHFTQSYISDNWYQGGENNLNILGDIKWDFNLNQTLHPEWLFNNSLSYKLGVATAQADTVRKYTINEDNFLFTSQLGYKAVHHWYYSAMLQAKTQFLNNYKPNSNDMTAAFLSPGELNLGLGMTYDYKSTDATRTFTLALAPLSYNLKICRDIEKLDPVNFGIDAGHHTKHSLGSNMEMKLQWKMRANISWQSRLYAFTDYKYVQGDWENTFDFMISRHLNTQIYTHLRYDRSRPRHDDWKYWQFKEILSFGITYRFATL